MITHNIPADEYGVTVIVQEESGTLKVSRFCSEVVVIRQDTREVYIDTVAVAALCKALKKAANATPGE